MIFSGHLPAIARCVVTNCPKMMRLITDLAHQGAQCDFFSGFVCCVFGLIESNGNLSASFDGLTSLASSLMNCKIIARFSSRRKC